MYSPVGIWYSPLFFSPILINISIYIIAGVTQFQIPHDSTSRLFRRQYSIDHRDQKDVSSGSAYVAGCCSPLSGRSQKLMRFEKWNFACHRAPPIPTQIESLQRRRENRVHIASLHTIILLLFTHDCGFVFHISTFLRIMARWCSRFARAQGEAPVLGKNCIWAFNGPCL